MAKKPSTNPNAIAGKKLIQDRFNKGKGNNKKAGLNGMPSDKDKRDKEAGKSGVGKTTPDKKSDHRKYSDDPVLRYQQQEADKARRDEKKRQERIDKGKRLINEQFARFDPAYYAKRETDFRNTYQPQIDEDFGKARDAMTFALARAGIGLSTAAVDRKKEIVDNRDRNNAMLSSKVAADRSQTEKTIADEKTALIDQLTRDAKAQEIGNQATARTTNLYNDTPDYQGFGDIFYGAAQGVAGVGQAVQNAQYANTFNGGGGGFGTSPRSTGVRNSTNIW